MGDTCCNNFLLIECPAIHILSVKLDLCLPKVSLSVIRAILHGRVKNALALANQASRSIQIREDDDFGFMTIQFLYKQIQHSESLLSLVPRRDAGLIARTMIQTFGASLLVLSEV